jgi:hypothetical protein
MTEPTRFDSLADAAERFGSLSLDNYAQIRSVAENIATGFCRYLGGGGSCVYLVPPEGAWTPARYGSGAFSVSGTGFLPLGAIQFGLAVRVSRSDDWVRLVLNCSKGGHTMNVDIQNGRSFSLNLPLDDAALTDVFDQLHGHLVDWFEDRADRYEHGDYGSRDIGFDFLHKSPEDSDQGT